MASSRKRHGRHHSKKPVFHWRTLRLAGIICFLCLAIVAITAAVMQTSAITFGRSNNANSSCGGLTHAVAIDQNSSAIWVTVRTDSTSDVMAAIKCTPMFQSASSGNDLVARGMQHGHLATPVLVKAYRNDVGLADVWVLPVVDQNNFPLVMMTFVYDESARQLRGGELAAVTGNMFYVNHTFPFISPNAAAAATFSQHHVAMASAHAPELIYFPPDTDGFQAGKYHWQGGGTSYLDPIWRVPGADGRWHYVDHDGQAHLSSELPLEPDYLAVPSSVAVQ